MMNVIYENAYHQPPSPVVDRSLIRDALQFFDSYLCLCRRYRVVGNAQLVFPDTGSRCRRVLLSCTLFSLDGKRAVSVFRALHHAGTQAWQAQDCLEYARSAQRQCITDFFGAAALHESFLQPSQYQFGDPEVTVSSATITSLCRDTPCRPTLLLLRRELLQRYPTVRVILQGDTLSVYQQYAPQK